MFRTRLTCVDGLTNLFREIKVKTSVAELSPQYQKLAEWLRIEYDCWSF